MDQFATCAFVFAFVAFCQAQVFDCAGTISPFGGREGPTFNISQFGGIGDNKTMNTAAFVKAVEQIAACKSGTLVVSGGVFITAPFNFTSHMTLYIAPDGAVVGPTASQLGPGPDFDTNIWPIIPPMPSYGQGRDHIGPRRTSLIHGEHLQDVKVTGDADNWGLLDGNGEPWWACHTNDRGFQPVCKGKETVTRGHLIEFMYTDGIEISNLRLRNSPFWTVHPFASSNIVVKNIDIWAPKTSPNTDGVDPDSCNNVVIENFTYHGGDDVIAIKSGWDCFGYKFGMPTANVVINNVTSIWTRAAGCAIGSEMSGGVINVTVSNCDFTNTGDGLNIKYSEYRGGTVHNIKYSNIIMGNVSGAALRVNGYYGSKNPSCSSQNKMPCPVHDVSYYNITQGTGTSVQDQIDFEGLSTNSIKNIKIDGLHLDGPAVKKCSLVSGTYHDAPAAASCSGLSPE